MAAAFVWANGVNGIYKINEETYEVMDHLPSPDAAEYDKEWADAITASLDEDNSIWNLWTSVKAIMPLASLSGIYAVVADNGWFYIAKKDGSIEAYGDSVEGDPTSKIELKAKFQLEGDQAGPSIGMNMTFDGWIVFPTENGYLIAVSQDLKAASLDPPETCRYRRSVAAEPGLWLDPQFYRYR